MVAENLRPNASTTAQGDERRSTLLTLSGVRKLYGGSGGQPTVAIDRADLEIRRGEFISITGPSGCGKSTLLQIAAGLVEATDGAVLMDGTRVSGPPANAVYLFQQYTKSLFPWRSVCRNVEFALEHKSIPAPERRARAIDYLDRVGLSDFAEHFPWQLSGGMQQRVAIARALAAEPQLMLMDEPFSAVDALTRIDLQSLILDIWSKTADLTIVFVTHDVDEAVYLSDRVAVMTRRPSSVAEVIETSLPRPRHSIDTREDPIFLQRRHELLTWLLSRER